MRVVRNGEEFQQLLESCRSESQKSFGDDKVLIEKYLVRPRLIDQEDALTPLKTSIARQREKERGKESERDNVHGRISFAGMLKCKCLPTSMETRFTCLSGTVVCREGTRRSLKKLLL